MSNSRVLEANRGGGNVRRGDRGTSHNRNMRMTIERVVVVIIAVAECMNGSWIDPNRCGLMVQLMMLLLMLLLRLIVLSEIKVITIIPLAPGWHVVAVRMMLILIGLIVVLIIVGLGFRIIISASTTASGHSCRALDTRSGSGCIIVLVIVDALTLLVLNVVRIVLMIVVHLILVVEIMRLGMEIWMNLVIEIGLQMREITLAVVMHGRSIVGLLIMEIQLMRHRLLMCVRVFSLMFAEILLLLGRIIPRKVAVLYLYILELILQHMLIVVPRVIPRRSIEILWSSWDGGWR